MGAIKSRIELFQRVGRARGRAAPKTVDTVADSGQHQATAFWFDGKDADDDGKIEIAMEAAPQGTD